MLKYAVAEILDAKMAQPGAPFMRTAHRVTFDYTPKHGMLYVRSRMISSRCNDNFDEFPAEEIKAAYLTFIGKPVFVNHHNDDHRRARGVIIDAKLHEDRNPDGSPDTWVEGLMEVDAVRFPKLAKAIIAGHIDRTSMGVDVAHSICSVCANKATTPLEYCAHIPGQKGRQHVRIEASTGSRVSTLIREKCYGLRFFENSLLVEQPADPTAYFLGTVERGPGLEHLAMTRTASRQPQSWGPTEPAWEHTPTPAALPYTQALGVKFAHGGFCPDCHGDDTITTTASQGWAECISCAAVYLYAGRGPDYPNPADHPFFQEHQPHMEHVLHEFSQGTADEHEQGRRWYPDGQIISQALGDLHQKLHGNVHPQGNLHMAAHMISNYSPQMGWHGNLNNAARVLHDRQPRGGPGEGIFAAPYQKRIADQLMNDHKNGGGLLKAPKTHNFGHLLEHGGMDPATGKQSHLVVVDRHALSVATGKQVSKETFNAFPNSTFHYYDHAARAYQDAAAHLSAQTGHEWAPHMVQAATWLTRQRKNEEDENARQERGELTPRAERAKKGREVSRANDERTWSEYAEKHIPHVQENSPGTGYKPGGGRAASRGRRGRH